MTDRTFDRRDGELAATLMSVPFVLMFVAFGVVLLAGGEPVVAVACWAGAVLAGGWVVWDLRYRPDRVVVTDDGVLLRAPAREVVIGWADLVSVERRPGRNSRLLWRRRRGRPVSTSDGFVDLHRLLTEVERRAPHVVVQS